MNTTNAGAPAPLVTDEDREAYRNRPSKRPKVAQEELGTRFIRAHGNTIEQRVRKAVSQKVRKRGHVRYVEAIILEKKPKRREAINRKGLKLVRSYLEQTLKAKYPETARVRISHSWFSDPADGHRKYTIRVSFRSALR